MLNQTTYTPEQIGYFKARQSRDGQLYDAVDYPTAYLRGQVLASGTATFAASATQNTTETVTINLQSNQDKPQWVQVTLINHADAAVSAVVYQQIEDVVAGTGTINVPISSTANLPTTANTEQVLLQFPFAVDNVSGVLTVQPLLIIFTATAAMTNGGNVGAILRYE